MKKDTDDRHKKKGIAGKIARYALTPQLLPRIKSLFFSGFSHIAFFMAQIYRSARLLPAGHPYLNPSNLGLFGIRHVIVEAGGNLVISRKNIDQIVIYILMLTGTVVLFAQMFMLILAVFVQTANAWTVNLGGPVASTFSNYYLIPDATHDVAFVMLDRVFGIPNFFTDAAGGTTCVAQGVPCFDLGQSSRVITPDTTIYTNYERTTTVTGYGFPWPFHRALQQMFKTYSEGILVVAIFILSYFVMAIVAETAQTGTPFGRRFNRVWAPLRMIAAIGLLVPLTNGLNSAQYILLYAAKFGSGFATNGWVLFNNAAVTGVDTLLGNTEELVGIPNAPPVNTLIEFGTVLATCKMAYERMYHERTVDGRTPADIRGWLVNPRNMAAPLDLATTNFMDAVDYFDQGDIIVRFGEKRGDEFQTNDGGIEPTCGEIVLQMTSTPEDIAAAGLEDPGGSYLLTVYYILIQQIWNDARGGSASCPYKDTASAAAALAGFGQQGCIGHNVANRYLPIQNDPNAPLPDGEVLDAIRTSYQYLVEAAIAEAVLRQKDSTEWLEQLTQLGWGGAGIWYNKVAQMNGSLIGAAYNLPVVKSYPKVMEAVRKEKATSDTDAPSAMRYLPYRGPDEPVMLPDEEEMQIAKALYAAQDLWRDHYFKEKKGGNIWVDIVNMIFGTNGLFNMQENADQRIHPLAQLASIGRSIIDTSLRNLGFSAAAGLGGGIINLFDEHLGGVGLVASGFLSQIAITGLTIGFVLYYIIPLMPFIYFFFAVGGWVKGIFEAMVGVPLWALAHIRIDGEGLPGDAAMGGYYLILEIFLRPIMIIFGFLGSITVFSAQVQILHEIWPLIVSNAAGFDMEAAAAYDPNQSGGMRYFRGAIDKFFFTVIYAIVVYMLGLSAFKMIDLVPNEILRWLGASISSFGDQSGDPAQNLVRNSSIGAGMVTGPLRGAMGSLKEGASGGAKAAGELFGPEKK